ncbi:MAG: hypothetical protein LBQ58_03930 [Synergistaceae bacterium]|nr:hypothetical protein [Synergistaceae bacterium]
MKRRSRLLWFALLVFFFVLSSGGCGPVDDIMDSFLPDEGQFNGTWKAAGYPDIVISGFDFQDSGHSAYANVKIGVYDFGRLRFSSPDGDTYVHNNGSDYMSAKVVHTTASGYEYYSFYVKAIFKDQGIDIRNTYGGEVVYKK